MLSMLVASNQHWLTHQLWELSIRVWLQTELRGGRNTRLINTDQYWKKHISFTNDPTVHLNRNILSFCGRRPEGTRVHLGNWYVRQDRWQVINNPCVREDKSRFRRGKCEGEVFLPNLYNIKAESVKLRIQSVSGRMMKRLWGREQKSLCDSRETQADRCVCVCVCVCVSPKIQLFKKQLIVGCGYSW